MTGGGSVRGAARGPDMVTAVVVTCESAGVLEACLNTLAAAAPERGITILVVDNASTDGSADLAARRLGEAAVLRMQENRGFAAGVNEVLRGFAGRWLALINPDILVPTGALDRLADALEAWPRSGLAGPRIGTPGGGTERSAGFFPTLARERAHALFLDRLAAREGRLAHVPDRAGPVDWLSGCAWLLRGEAVREVGPLDESYFMYFEDVDYCRRLRNAGWDVVAVPEVEMVHGGGAGSARSSELPADGGDTLLRYFRKFHPEVPEAAVLAELRRGWRIRRVWHLAWALLGNTRSAMVARRYAQALAGAPMPSPLDPGARD